MPFGTIAASGWAAGLSLYGTAFILGLAGRLDWADTPTELQSTWVLVALGVLFVTEVVIDKVAYLDSIWDAVHTVVRPIGGGLLAVLLADGGDVDEVIAALTGGAFALSAHSAKASARAAVNTSPEPVSNVAVSLGEDGLMAGMVALALAYPVVAGVVAVVLALASVALTWVLLRMLRRLRERFRARRGRRPGPGSSPATWDPRTRT